MSASDALEIARSLFGISAAAARDVGSERDRTFVLEATDGEPRAVLKVSNASEDPAVLDMEAEVALHVSAVDPTLLVAVPRRRADASDRAAVAELRAEWESDDGSHWCRAYDVLPGHSRIDATALSDAALVAWGETTARDRKSVV